MSWFYSLLCPCSSRRMHCWLKICRSPTDSQQTTSARPWLQVTLVLMVVSQFHAVLQRKCFHPWYVVPPLSLPIWCFFCFLAHVLLGITLQLIVWAFPGETTLSAIVNSKVMLFLELPGFLTAAASTGAHSQGPAWSGMALSSYLSRWAMSKPFFTLNYCWETCFATW